MQYGSMPVSSTGLMFPEAVETVFTKVRALGGGLKPPWSTRWGLRASKSVCLAVAIVCCSSVVYDQAGDSGLEEHCYEVPLLTLRPG